MTRFPCRTVITLLVLCGVPQLSQAQVWKAEGQGAATSAGFSQKGRLAGLVFRCTQPGRVRLLLSGDGTRFSDERPRTLVLSVDGLAERTTVTAEAEPNGKGASRFAREDTLAQADALLTLLSKGREVEVSGPSGMFRLPLKGSGAAIARLRAGCGG
ncbi:hypothetical protein [Aureimonas jatrophae]|uniref:Invasion protein IalB, involved in pathogenesis n=1 Tax=Aureimonas jatrophae TaxID=1166073 RepID=A0A1H0IJA6_9HYPH|nr:hypothetical protein [Aureimonas jatrophae]MBB3952209.1 hypothetical protein [Aureimonas jatrophae]SDO31537.1 hypothetical protein SAMN05192530_105185 [Aureimonas jatrophae]